MPSVRSSSMSPGLSVEEEAERELLEAIVEPEPHSHNGSDDPMDEIDELAGDDDTTHNTAANDHNLSSHIAICREVAAARRKADSLKLHPYQRTYLEDFVKSTPLSRQTSLMAQLFAVGNNIASLKLVAPPFVTSPQLLENIKSISIAVLLSCNLSAYKKSSVPVGHVMTVLSARKCLPENIVNDSYAQKIIKTDIQDELTQARARIKKAIKDSINPIANESDTIFELATTIISNSKSTVSVPLCARIALLRKIFIQYNDATFWDKVDDRLSLIRTTAKGDARKITRMFEDMLDKDRKTYGDSTTYTLDSTSDVFQTSVDDIIGTGSLESNSNI